MIYCEAPVATPLHRAFAAAIDMTMVMVAFGFFLLTFVLCGGEIIVNRPNLIVFGCALGLVAATYGIFWTVAGTETVGMRWTHLRLITFRRICPRLPAADLSVGGHLPQHFFGPGDTVVTGG
ncbi:MAG: hypothetical protein WDO73_10590 [Ignavibacteriota bacterium]